MPGESGKDAARVDGVVSASQHPYERDTTRGTSEVAFDSGLPGNAVALKEVVCSICGSRSYTVTGICPYQNDICHVVDRVLRRGDSV